jgi:hypothetical protein
MSASHARFELSAAQWGAAVDEVRQAVLDAASDARTISYGEIAVRVTSIRLSPHSVVMDILLADVFALEHAAGRPALTAIVTAKFGSDEAARGFFACAQAHGYTFLDPAAFRAEQVDAVFRAHARVEA